SGGLTLGGSTGGPRRSPVDLAESGPDAALAAPAGPDPVTWKGGVGCGRAYPFSRSSCASPARPRLRRSPPPTMPAQRTAASHSPVRDPHVLRKRLRQASSEARLVSGALQAVAQDRECSRRRTPPRPRPARLGPTLQRAVRARTGRRKLRAE